jgi:hypothetical protein
MEGREVGEMEEVIWKWKSLLSKELLALEIQEMKRK